MLGRQALRAGLGAWTRRGACVRAADAVRFFASDKPTGDALPEEFKDAWKKVAPNLDLPRFPISYMAERPDVPSTIPSKVTVNLVLPYKFEIAAKEVDMVIVPATTGQLGVLPGHVPTILELKPGVLSVHEGNDIQKWFVSSGFAFIHRNSVLDVVIIEGANMDQLDPEEIRKGLADYTQMVNTANTDLEKAQAQIGLEVHSALNTALAA